MYFQEIHSAGVRQLKLLMDYNCNYGQGFYFSKPVPKELFADLLKNELNEK